MSWPDCTPSLTTVLPTPAPSSVIALLMLTRVAHVNVPAGNTIVSPFWASVSWMYCTFVDEISQSSTAASAEKLLQLNVIAALAHPTRDLNMSPLSLISLSLASIDADGIKRRQMCQG